MQCSGALLPASCSALRSLPETRARERLRARDKRTSIRVYRGGVRVSIGGGVGTGVRRVGPGARSLCREATLHTRLLAFLGSDDREAAAPWFLHVLKPARRNVVAAAAVSARVLHTIKQQEFTSSAQRTRFKYSRAQANSNSSRNAPEARGNAQQTRRRVQTYREKNLFVVPLHDGVKGQTSAAFGKRRGAGIRQLPCHSISRAPSQQPRPHAIAALPMDVGHPS